MNESMNRAERRRYNRENGRSCVWEKKLSPKELKQGSGWFAELDRVWINNNYCVMARTVVTEWGVVEHVCIRNTSSTDIPWREKQRIKNELFGEEFTAIEVYPPESELIDEANMYHIWILKDVKIPFSLYTKK